MKTPAQTYTFTFTTIVLVFVVCWVAYHTWQDLRQLHRGFASAQIADLDVARQIEASVLELNALALRVNLRSNAADLAVYQEKSDELSRWITAHKDALSTSDQISLLNQIESAYTNYLAQSRGLLDKQTPRQTPAPATADVQPVEFDAAPVLDLCHALETSEQTENAGFMKDSQQSLIWIQVLLAAMFLLLIVSAATAMVAINRGVVDPLRLKLMESRAVALRNEKLASLGTLAAGVAHEIRNPLTAINVRLHSLKKNLVSNSSEQEDAQVIDHEIQRLERIVQGFLQFARPSEPKLMTVSADSLLSRIRSLFESQLANASIKLNVLSVPDLWLQADPHQIEQVLINLVQNAADSIGTGGSITLRAHTGKARLSGRNTPVAMLQVIDTGKGIPPEVRKRIFDPFFTTKEEGTGLGLAISQRIIEKHSGTLECRSDNGRGTTFTILLPRNSNGINNEFNI
jgi:signal transduction histidine kinase